MNPVFSGNYKTWGDVRRNQHVIEDKFQRGLFLNVNGHETPPSEVNLPDLATQSNQASLPKFVPAKIVWHNVGLINAAFAPDLVTAKFKVDSMNIVQLVLEEKMPWWRVLFRSMLIGYQHILPSGLDHILFVLGIYLATRRFSDLLWQVTAFTVAHSITLGLTMSGIILVGAFGQRLVEIGIAVSIFVIAFENCLWANSPRLARILVVGAFGLVHGMGFAGRLAEVKWPQGTFLLSLFGANVGIELGQLTVIAAASLLTAWWIHCSWYRSRVAVPISLLIGLYGMFAALDRISQLNFPRKEFLGFWWQLYDKYYWAVPLGIGAVVLLALWIGYRTSRLLYRNVKSVLFEGIRKKQEI
jgi:hydrogenase/urease accessory protein HupE